MTNNNKCTDFELINQYRLSEDNNNALNELVERYKGAVIAIASKYQDFPIEREDLIQEGMIGLFAAINSYRDDKNATFATYADRCINNSIKSALKKLSRLKDIPQDSIIPLDDAINEVGYSSQSAEHEYLDLEIENEFYRILYEELSKFENEVVRLYLTGCSYNEIAKKLCKTPKAIDNAMQRIRKKLLGVTF